MCDSCVFTANVAPPQPMQKPLGAIALLNETARLSGTVLPPVDRHVETYMCCVLWGRLRSRLPALLTLGRKESKR